MKRNVGKWLRMRGHMTFPLFSGARSIVTKLSCQEWFVISLLFCSLSNSFSDVGEVRGHKDTRREARTMEECISVNHYLHCLEV